MNESVNILLQAPKAWVVFNGQASVPWVKILKPGYRHCYALLNDGAHWITLDPLSSHTDVQVHDLPADFDLPLWLKNQGENIMPAPVRRIRKEAPWNVFSCVEAVKRVLGLHNWFIFTPWQLYCYLTKIQNHKGDLSWEV